MIMENNLPDVKILGKLEEGQEVQIDGVFYFIGDMREDTEGDLQVTFYRWAPKREAITEEE